MKVNEQRIIGGEVTPDKKQQSRDKYKNGKRDVIDTRVNQYEQNIFQVFLF